jgi:hypothetical protein
MIMVKSEDIHIHDTVKLSGDHAIIIDSAEYDGIKYVKLSYRGILVPLTAIWKESNGDLTVS